MIHAATIEQTKHLDRLVGIRFLWGGRTGDGLDCYGVLLAVLTILDLPMTDVWDRIADLYEQKKEATGEFITLALIPEGWSKVTTRIADGDVILIPGHCAVYAFGYVYTATQSTGVVRHPWRSFHRRHSSEMSTWRFTG